MMANGIYADFDYKLDEVYYKFLLEQHNHIRDKFSEKVSGSGFTPDVRLLIFNSLS